MGILLGFDPGGKEHFGWCVCNDSNHLPLTIRASGLGNHAQDAVSSAFTWIGQHEHVLGAGIDAPMYWVADGDRVADLELREAIKCRGAQYSGGTVQHVNSLRGACLVQGIITACLLRKQVAGIPISECHPKAALWLLGIAHVRKPPKNVTLVDLKEYILHDGSDISEHERDAMIGALSAWAMVHQTSAWKNLFLPEREHAAVLPVEQPISYWMPCSQPFNSSVGVPRNHPP